jgi:D-alanyl-D-alanine carboxypeptidase
MLAVAVAAPPAYAAPPAAGQLKSAVADLHALGVTGVQGLVGRGGRVSTAQAGVADVTTGAPVPDNGYFRMGSNTKTFVSVVVLQLVGEGRLSLDDTVDRWLPGVVSGNGNDGGRITVRQLLQHTSGVANYTDDLDVLRSADGYREHRLDHYTAAELVALAMKHAPGFEPGTSWQYSNTNYVLAGMIVQRVTGHGWAVEVQRRILAPLGLRQTYAPGDVATLRRPHAEGYQQFEPGGPLVDTTEFNPTAADAAGSLVSTPRDLARFWQSLQGGRLLRPAQMAQLHETVEVEPGLRYGLGIMWVADSCGGFWAHFGDVPGTSTLNAVTTDGSEVVVLSLNTGLADPQRAEAVQTRALRLVDETLCP